tara:strand:+ start:1542 stop:1697 length:156 start_codon:yes stop_codon:yes gene_type:complete
MSKHGEKYKSKKQMVKHERSERGEGKREREMEYGKGAKKNGNGCCGRKSCS